MLVGIICGLHVTWMPILTAILFHKTFMFPQIMTRVIWVVQILIMTLIHPFLLMIITTLQNLMVLILKVEWRTHKSKKWLSYCLMKLTMLVKIEDLSHLLWLNKSTNKLKFVLVSTVLKFLITMRTTSWLPLVKTNTKTWLTFQRMVELTCCPCFTVLITL